MIRHRFSAEDFHRMAEAGILGEDDRVELIRGEVVELSPVGKRHMAALKRLMNALFPLQQAKKALLQVQDPLRLFPDTEPQPDLALLAYRDDFYRERVPEAKDALLVVEVAETSLDHDLQVKLPLYAQAGIPEVWVVDLVEGRVHRFLDPSPGGYREHHVLGPGDTLSPRAFPGLSVSVASLL